MVKAKLVRKVPFEQQAQYRGMPVSVEYTDETLLVAENKIQLAAMVAVAELDGWRISSK
jgi:hypothetical protein